MAYPASRQALSDAFAEANRTAITIKNQLTSARSQMTSGNVPSSLIISLLGALNTAISQLDRIAAISGIAEYARAQMQDANLDVATEFATMLAEMASTRDWIVANFPTDSDGYLLSRQFSGTDVISRMFTPIETSALRDRLDAVIATID